jgi:hypothetical protein
MADISMVARTRQQTLERVLEVLGMDLRIPSTKIHPIQTEAFYLKILDALAARVVALEVLAKRADGHSEILAEQAERVGSLERGRNSHAERLDELDEAVASLFNRAAKAEASEAGE